MFTQIMFVYCALMTSILIVSLSWDIIEQLFVKPIEDYLQQKEFEAMTAKDMAATNEGVAVEQEPYLQALDTLGVEREDVEFYTIEELKTIGRIWWATIHQADTEWKHLVNSINLNQQEKTSCGLSFME